MGGIRTELKRYSGYYVIRCCWRALVAISWHKVYHIPVDKYISDVFINLCPH